MFSPRPAELTRICLWNPSPNASSRLIAAVPQTMPKAVRKVRSFWLARSRQSCRIPMTTPISPPAAARAA